MPDERTDRNDTPEGDEKPTITIAEKQRAAAGEEKPTITIAERGDEE